MSDNYKSGYESLVWINDKAGKEYSCSIDAVKDGSHNIEAFSEKELSNCLDVSSIVGTERW